jgi:hypothetical protein
MSTFDALNVVVDGDSGHILANYLRVHNHRMLNSILKAIS